MQWDPAQYGRYADERGRPFVELLGRIHADSPHRVVDLGCGPGHLTALLAQRWPDANVEGIDSSPEMIAATDGVAGASFRVGDIGSYQVEPDTDVLISNAALQWVPGHEALLRSWAEALPSGGWLAWQVPGNLSAPSHAVLRGLASTPRWVEQIGSAALRPDAVRSAADYATLLLGCGLRADVWETTYYHVLAGPDPVLEWMRGTGLRPVFARLSPSQAAEFEAEYGRLLRLAYPAGRGGTLFPFHRIFGVGHKP